MPVLTNLELSRPFVFEPEVSDRLKWIGDKCVEIFSHLPNIYTQTPESDFFKEHIKENYALYDPVKPIIQMAFLEDMEPYKELRDTLLSFGLSPVIKYFQSDPTKEVFKKCEHLFFAHRHHYQTSVASLIFPIQGCDEHTLTSWPAYEDVDGYVPEDTSIESLYSEYYWKTYNKGNERYLLTDEEAACRYALTDRPVLWNVKQWHEAYNQGTKHRVIANINFKDYKKTWEESIDAIKEI